MRTCLFEDHEVALLEPISTTRPVFDILCGQTSLRTKQQWYCGSHEVGVLIRPALEELFQVQNPHTPHNSLDWIREGPVLFLNGRFLPPDRPLTMINEPHLGMVGYQLAYAWVPPHEYQNLTISTLDEHLRTWKENYPLLQVAGKVIRHLWEIVDENGPQMELDFRLRTINRASEIPPGVAVIGPHDSVLIDPTSSVEPMVLLDTTRGPVVIGPEANVMAFTRLEGPCFIGKGTHVFGAKIRANTTIGPHCRVGGEVESSIVHGYSNKYHDGFLGHSYLGEWVNLGAGTNNSDLRNDYGEVKVPIFAEPTATGRGKVGCFIGDHVKTGLGTLINTGSNIGCFANLLPAGILAPKYIPAFSSWWKGKLKDGSNLDQVFQTAHRVMQRRGLVLTEAHRKLYQHLYEETAFIRRKVLVDLEKQALSYKYA